MKKISFTVLALIMSFILYSQNEQLEYVERPIEYEMFSAPDSIGNTTKLEFPDLNKSSTNLKIPYPIILIHGLAGNSATWNTFTAFLKNQYNFNYGGRFDFCLNYDNDNSEANLDYYDTPDADLALWTPTLVVGEYYKINFDVGINGTFHPDDNYQVNSNQQAIVKQGKVLRWAIYEILELTGAEKVILFGHSMGGLAAREYMQNPINWQPDGDHHVAKLVTTGTPHGGSNATSFGIGVNGVNEKLDATRDLRRSYAISGDNGVYLYGGLESHVVLWNNLFFDYKNIDVNCNGIVGENITGINQKNIYANLSYSCIIGICSDCILGGVSGDNDGIVKASCANLENYYIGLNVEKFYHYANSTFEIHTDLPKQIYKNMQALDEANEPSHSYNIEIGRPYLGFVTVQEQGGNTFDCDIYKFSVENETSVRINIQNIVIDDFLVSIKDMSGKTIEQKEYSDGSHKLELFCNIPQGNYYLEVYGIPTSTSYKYPYQYSLTNITAISEFNNRDSISIYPNPANYFFTIKDYSYEKENILVNIISLSGEALLDIEFTGQKVISTEKMKNGMYFLQVNRKRNVVTKKLIISK